MEAPSYPSLPTSFLELALEFHRSSSGDVVASLSTPDAPLEPVLFPMAALPDQAEIDAIAGLAILRGYSTEPIALMRDVGRRLFRASLGGPFRRHFVELSEQSMRTGQPVAIRIAADDERLMAQPWELLTDDWSRRTNEFLVLSGTPVVRMLPKAAADRPRDPQASVRVLVLLADLRGVPVERDVAVLRDVAPAMGVLEIREFQMSAGTTPRAVVEAIADADVVHYAGAGARDYYANTDGKLSAPAIMTSGDSRLDAGELAEEIADHTDLKLVVLNGELTDRVAARLAQQVPTVVGFRGRPRGDACLAFASGLFQAIAAGASLRVAVLAGRQQVQYRFPQDAFWSLPAHWDRGDSTLVAYTSPGDDHFEVEHPEEDVALLLEQRALLQRNLDAVRQRIKGSPKPPLPTLAEQEVQLTSRVTELDEQIQQRNL